MKKILLITIGFTIIISCNAQNGTGKSASQSNTDFAFKLYAELSNEKSNMFFSPFSVSAALSMTYVGASGETAEEMKSVLSIEKEAEAYHYNMKEIINKLDRKDETEGAVKISVANSLWAQQDYKFSGAFMKDVAVSYNAPIENMEFAKAESREQTRKSINDKVADQTNGKIKELIGKDVLTDATRLLLINALHFEGAWEIPFKDGARALDFTYKKGKTKKVAFMQGIFDSKHYSNEMLDMITIPYKNNVAELIIIIPKEVDGLSDLQKELNYNNFNKWTAGLSDKKANILLPIFKISQSYELDKPLKKMGMKSAFGRKADFSKMTGSQDLFINAVLHKAVFEIDQKGTKAAAASSVVMDRKSGSKYDISLSANHPFIFMVKENSTNSILFIGHYVKPQ